jgi:hypothetical protein
MKIYHIGIRNFRGIKTLNWATNGSMICLIGPGDSTKSTILDAIEYALSARWSIPFADTDFYLNQVSDPIEITLTVGHLPNKLIDDRKFGHHLRGWSTKDGMHDEPEDGDELVISVSLRVDDTLEPSWFVVTDRNPEGIRISSRDREMLGVTRLGPYVDRHLSWGRGSALSRLTGDLEIVPAILAEAGRKAREAVTSSTLDTLNKAAEQAQAAAIELGVKPSVGYHPALDAQLNVGGTTTLTLHDGEVPTRLAGLGSRRLITLAIQRNFVQDGAILLVDEVEQGLEPFRLRHLLRVLRPPNERVHQIFMTTHSNVAIEEINAEELYIVRSNEGNITVRQVAGRLQATVRKTPESLLGRKIIVCEGKTELGMCRALDRAWAEQPYGLPLAHLGVVPAHGGGDDAPRIAIDLAGLGYDVAFVGDSDKSINPGETELKTAGVRVVRWANGLTIEQRVSRDLPQSALDDLVNLAVEVTESNDRQSVLDSIGSRLGLKTGQLADGVDTWLVRGFSEDQIREAIGNAAKQGSWFKRIDKGEKLGELISQHLSAIPTTDLAKKIEALRGWAYG